LRMTSPRLRIRLCQRSLDCPKQELARLATRMDATSFDCRFDWPTTTSGRNQPTGARNSATGGRIAERGFRIADLRNTRGLGRSAPRATELRPQARSQRGTLGTRAERAIADGGLRIADFLHRTAETLARIPGKKVAAPRNHCARARDRCARSPE